MARLITGKIISTSTPKTVVVEVERKVRHEIYKKIIKKNKKYLVDPGSLQVKVGDVVSIAPTRPISKKKKFKLVSVEGGEN